MAALSRFVAARPRLVAIAAVLTALIALPLTAHENDHLLAGDTISANSQSAHVSNAMERGDFPGAEVAPMAVVLDPTPAAQPGDLVAAIGVVSGQVKQVQGTHVRPAGAAAALASARTAPHRSVVLPIDFGSGVGIDQAREVTNALEIENPKPARTSGGRVEVHLVGEGALWAAFIERADTDTKAAEARGLPVVVLVLLFAFGSLAAALLPVVLGGFAIVVAGAIVYLISLVTDMSIFAVSVVSMVGLGVAIDYSLFILVRYREELRGGYTPDRAREIAMATSGRAVAYSGLIVTCSMSALFLISSPGVRSIAAGTIIVVAVAVGTALTVLPVVIGKLGRRAYEPGRVGAWLQRRRGDVDRRAEFWSRWTSVVMRRPALCLAMALAVMLTLAAPALDLRVRNGAQSQLPANNQAIQAMREIKARAGPGSLGPAQVMVSSTSGPLAPAMVGRVAAAIRRDPAVASLAGTHPSRNGDRALITAVLRVDPESSAARATIERLRRTLPAAAPDTRIEIGGTTAIILDFYRLVTAQLWRPILFVLVASFVLLLVLLRSPVLALKATLMNLMSVLAAYGALVAVFQYGWLEFLGIDKAQSIYPIAMPLVLAAASGLSMDYHIFMLSRIKEAYLATGDTRLAVSQALASSASPITSAALVMVVVFFAFVSAGAPSIQQLGFALAVAIAVDATIVRIVLVPAAMVLLGRWNWWPPPPLAALKPIPQAAEEPT